MVNSWEYVAGFWDGEGCIWMPVGKGRTVSASISQTDPKVLIAIKEFLERQGLKPKLRKQSGKSKKAFNDKADHWTILFQGTKKTSFLLEKLLPFLNTKKKIYAQDVLRFFTIFPSLRKERKTK